MQEKKFLQQRIESQKLQYDQKMGQLQRKVDQYEKKYQKRNESLKQMKENMEANIQNFLEIQKQNETEFIDEVEYIHHLYTKVLSQKDLYEEKFMEAIK